MSQTDKKSLPFHAESKLVIFVAILILSLSQPSSLLLLYTPTKSLQIIPHLTHDHDDVEHLTRSSLACPAIKEASILFKA